MVMTLPDPEYIHGRRAELAGRISILLDEFQDVLLPHAIEMMAVEPDYMHAGEEFDNRGKYHRLGWALGLEYQILDDDGHYRTGYTTRFNPPETQPICQTVGILREAADL